MALLSGGASPHSPSPLCGVPSVEGGWGYSALAQTCSPSPNRIAGFSFGLTLKQCVHTKSSPDDEQGVSFQRNCGAASVGKRTQNFGLSTELIRWIGHHKEIESDVSSISPSSEWIKELWVALGLYGERWSYAIGRNTATWKTRIS